MKKALFFLGILTGILNALPVFAFTNLDQRGYKIFSQPQYSGYTVTYNPTAFRSHENFIFTAPTNGWNNKISGIDFSVYFPTSTAGSTNVGFTIYEVIATTTDGGNYFATGGSAYADCRTTYSATTTEQVTFKTACTYPSGNLFLTSGKTYALIDSNFTSANDKYFYVGMTPHLALYDGNYGGGILSPFGYESKAVTGGTRFWKINDSDFSLLLNIYSASTTSSTAPIKPSYSVDCDQYSDFASWSICNIFVTQLTPSESAFYDLTTAYNKIQNKPPFGYLYAYINAFYGFNSSSVSSSIETGTYGFAELVDGISNMPLWTTFYNFEIMLLWLLFAIYVFNRFRHFDF